MKFNELNFDEIVKGNFFIHENKIYYIFNFYSIFQELKEVNLEINFNIQYIFRLFKDNDKIYEFTSPLTIDKIIKYDYIIIDLNQYQSNFLYNLDNNLFIDRFKIELEFFNSDIFDQKYIATYDFNNILNNFNLEFSNIDFNSHYKIFLFLNLLDYNVNYFYPVFLNCAAHESFKALEFIKKDQGYYFHRIKKLLNLKYWDFNFFKQYVTNKKYKEDDLVAFLLKNNQTAEYIDLVRNPDLIKYIEYLKKFLNINRDFFKINEILDITQDNNKKVILYLQTLNNYNYSDYFFNFIFQQNYFEMY